MQDKVTTPCFEYQGYLIMATPSKFRSPNFHGVILDEKNVHLPTLLHNIESPPQFPDQIGQQLPIAFWLNTKWIPPITWKSTINVNDSSDNKTKTAVRCNMSLVYKQEFATE